MGPDGDTALTRAILLGHDGIVRALLQWGASPDLAGSLGTPPLNCAAKMGNEAIVKLLLGHGAKVDAREAGRERTALMEAVAGGHVGAVGNY